MSYSLSFFPYIGIKTSVVGRNDLFKASFKRILTDVNGANMQSLSPFWQLLDKELSVFEFITQLYILSNEYQRAI
jgi:hypothetical protein